MDLVICYFWYDNVMYNVYEKIVLWFILLCGISCSGLLC